MKILSIDQSITRTGWAVGTPGQVEDFGSWVKPKDLTEDVDIFLFYAKKVSEKAIESNAIYCLGEEWIKSGFPTQMLRSAALRGAIMAILKYTTVIDMIFFAPSEWRKAAGIDLKGLPRKGRRQILKQRAIDLCEALGLDVKNDDEAEAALILHGSIHLLETEAPAPSSDKGE